MNNPGEQVLERIREVVESSGISAYRIARDLDIAETTVRRLQHGEGVPQFETLARILDYLGYRLDVKRAGRKRG